MKGTPYLLSISCACMLLVSCSTQDAAKLQPAVADSVMIQVLIEMHLAEARAQMYNEDQSVYKDTILMRHGVSQQAFEANMAYYKANPDAFHNIYSQALDKMSDERFMQPGN